MSSKEEEEAKAAIKDAEEMIINSNFKNAKTMIQKAINLLPTIENGQQMITVCEILDSCVRDTNGGESRGSNWLYLLLQIPLISTESEVKSRYDKLMEDMKPLEGIFFGTRAAVLLLDRSMAIYKYKANKKRKPAASPSLSSQFSLALQDDQGEEFKDNVVDSAVVVAENDAEMKDIAIDDPYTSPEFKKLRKQIFDGFSQNPHYNPLSIYSSSSIREEMKLVLDARFVRISQKLFNSDDHLVFEEKTIRAELEDLKSHGYNVKPLEERLDLIARVVTLAKEEESCEEKLKLSEVRIGEEMVQLEKAQLQLEKVQCRISGLRRANEVLKADQVRVKSEYAALKSKAKMDDLSNIMKNV